MVKLDYVVLNAFTSSPSSGNPAAVIILPPPADVDQNDSFSSYPPTPALQAVATKLNYPMTAFLLPLTPSEGKYALRWLDPGTEVQLCGHATIALSEYLFSLPNPPRQLDLQTVKHGQVISEQLSNPFEESDKRVALDFPQILGFSEVAKSSQEWEKVEKGLREVTGVENLPLTGVAKNDHYVIVEFEKGFDMSAKGLPLNMDKLVCPGHSDFELA
jgi:predicted PhzF superfamily epimerase YddE/YHI9